MRRHIKEQTTLDPNPCCLRPVRAFLGWRRALSLPACLVFAFAVQSVLAQENLLKNPSFEESAREDGTPPNWERSGPNSARVAVADREAHEGRQCVSIPAQCAVEQRIENVPAGAYVLRCWVKSESDEPITLCLQDPDRPWEAFACAELQAPRNRWTRLEAFCVLDQKGTLAVMIGGMSDQFRLYHGLAGEMTSPILLDDCELLRREPAAFSAVALWDAGKELSTMPDWSAKAEWSPVNTLSYSFIGAPVFQARHLAGAVRGADGGLVICAIQSQALKARTVLVPSPPFTHPRCTVVHSGDRTGIHVASQDGEHAYTAWLTTKGLVSIEASHVQSFQAQGCALQYGVLPSLVGSDICYDPRQLLEAKQIGLPSTQWFVGLVHGEDSMLVAAWDTDSQAVSLGLAGDGENRMIDSLSLATDKAGFSISFVEHPGLWHKEPLKEDWLDDYVPVAWERPFPARCDIGPPKTVAGNWNSHPPTPSPSPGTTTEPAVILFPEIKLQIPQPRPCLAGGAAVPWHVVVQSLYPGTPAGQW